MVRSKQIMDAVNLMLVKALPEIKKVYRELLPQNAARPCVYLQKLKSSRAAAGCDTVHCTFDLRVTYIAELEKDKSCDTDKLLERQDAAIEALTQDGYILVDDCEHDVSGNLQKVGERALEVQELSADPTEYDASYTGISFDFFDDRTDKRPADVPEIQTVKIRTEA